MGLPGGDFGNLKVVLIPPGRKNGGHCLPSPGRLSPVALHVGDARGASRALIVSSICQRGGLTGRPFPEVYFRLSVRFACRIKPKSARKCGCPRAGDHLTLIRVPPPPLEEYISSKPWFHVSKVRIGLMLNACM